MAKNTDITFEVLNIQTEGQMVSAVIQLREYYEFEKLPQPPLPADVIKLAPCDLRNHRNPWRKRIENGKGPYNQPKWQDALRERMAAQPLTGGVGSALEPDTLDDMKVHLGFRAARWIATIF